MCTCEYNYTCGFCLQHSPAWHFTPSDSRWYFANAIKEGKQKQALREYLTK